jgi:hypothetical protein
VAFGKAETGCQSIGRGVGILAADPHRQLIVFPLGDGYVRLHRHVLLILGINSVFEGPIGLGEASLHIPPLGVEWATGQIIFQVAAHQRRTGLFGLAGVKDKGQRVVFYLDQIEGILGHAFVDGRYSRDRIAHHRRFNSQNRPAASSHPFRNIFISHDRQDAR